MLGPTTERAALAGDEQRVSVDVDAASLATVLTRLAHETGVAITGFQALHRTVSARLTDIPLAVALTRLIGGIDHVIVEELLPNGEIRVVGIHLFDGSPPSERSSAPVPRAADYPAPLSSTAWADHDLDVVERRAAALRLLGEAPQPGPAREDALANVERGLARQAEIDEFQRSVRR